ncbi:MAG: glycosyltransferase family 2 protein [Limisphaerales bacterium]
MNAPPRPMTIDISVVILSWNDKDHLVELLDSLQSTKRSMEIIVVDNASTDGSPELVEAKYPHVILIKNKENLGFPKGNNMGTRASRGKYVYLLNSDIKVLEGCMDALADFMDQNPKVGFCGPRIFNKDLTHQSSCRRNPTLWNNICSASGLASVFRGSKFFSGEHMFYFKGDRQIDVDVLVGCFWVVRRAAIDEFGLLDEGFFIYAEDVDWCKRCWKAGWRVVFFPGAQAIHYGGASTTKKDPVRFALTQQRSLLRYWKKHHGSLGRFSMACIIFSHLSLRWAAAFVKSLLSSGKREESRVKMQVAGACLSALFVPHQPEGSK